MRASRNRPGTHSATAWRAFAILDRAVPGRQAVEGVLLQPCEREVGRRASSGLGRLAVRDQVPQALPEPPGQSLQGPPVVRPAARAHGEPQPAVQTLGADLDPAAARTRLDAVADRVLDERLQNETRHECLTSIGCYVKCH